MKIPTHVKLGDQDLPPLKENQLRHVIALNGEFRERRTSMFSSSVRIRSEQTPLSDHLQYCRLHCGKLPRLLHRAMLAFFWIAHQAHGGEAALILLFHPVRRVFRWLCPVQTVEMYRGWSGWFASDQIEFEQPWELPDGFVHFGDAHLHPGSPQPSKVDLEDDHDGIHIIVGNILESPTYHIDFVVDDVRFRVPPEIFFEDLNCTPLKSCPPSWLKQIYVIGPESDADESPDAQSTNE